MRESSNNDKLATKLESEWSELAGGWFDAGGDETRPNLWLAPVLVLYTGFFFGPFVTFLTAVAAVRGRVSTRNAGIILGICGASWCLLQGLSIYHGGWWEEFELQGMRSTLNFGSGIVAYVVIRPLALRSFRFTRTTIAGSAVFALLCLVGFLLIPGSILVAMGR